MQTLHIPAMAWELASVDPAELSDRQRFAYQVRVASFLGGLWATMAACVGLAIGGFVGAALMVLNWGSLIVGPGEIPMGGADSVRAGALMGDVLVVALPVLAVGCGLMARRTWFVLRVWQSGQLKAWEHEALGPQRATLQGRGVWIWAQMAMAGALMAGSVVCLGLSVFLRFDGSVALAVLSLLCLVACPFWVRQALRELTEWRRDKALLDRDGLTEL